ncbi:MAG: ABC-type transport auxiliary lipoprotein family protein [Candidatus Kapaibacterium sp.]
MKKTSIFILLLVITTGCINVRTEYPAISYYELQKQPISLEKIDTVPGALQIRQFDVVSEFDTDAILARLGPTEVERYNYHRWITDLSSMVTDYILSRYSRAGAFTNGIIGATSMIVPDYILEGQVLEMIAVNSESEERGANRVVFILKANLIKRRSMEVERDILLSETYNIEIPRRNNAVATIAPAFSKAIAQASDRLLVDIQNAIAKYNRKLSRTR